MGQLGALLTQDEQGVVRAAVSPSRQRIIEGLQPSSRLTGLWQVTYIVGRRCPFPWGTQLLEAKSTFVTIWTLRL